MDNLMLRGAFGTVCSRSAAASSYLPTLRTICRLERLKEQDKVKRRYKPSSIVLHGVGLVQFAETEPWNPLIVPLLAGSSTTLTASTWVWKRAFCSALLMTSLDAQESQCVQTEASSKCFEWSLMTLGKMQHIEMFLVTARGPQTVSRHYQGATVK